jgi:hypothetical protein
MGECNAIIAVLSGDLVGSTGAGPAETDAAMAQIADWAKALSDWMPGTHDTRFTRFRGDGWQVILADPGLAFRAAMTLCAMLRAVDGLPTRIAIGIGSATLPEGDDLSAASGTGFEASGRALDALSPLRRLTIEGCGVTGLHRAILDLAEHITSRWSREQAEATAFYLHPGNPTLGDIARRLDISPQAVSYRLRGAGAQDLRQAARLWESHQAGGQT